MSGLRRLLMTGRQTSAADFWGGRVQPHRVLGLVGLAVGIVGLVLGVLLIQLRLEHSASVVDHGSEHALGSSGGEQTAVRRAARSHMYGKLTQWVQANARYLNGIGFVQAAETADRQETVLRTSGSETVGKARDLGRLVREYQVAVRAHRLARFELEGRARQEPFAVVLHDVLTQRHGGAAYEIEVLTWDAYPAFPVPANIYRPVHTGEQRLPVIITPLGCQTHLAVHNELNSVQRRAANLALRGFLVLAMADGVCFNGLVGERLENQFAFEQYGRLSGSGYSTLSIALLMFLRAVDYLATRSDTDMTRIGATGYSHGGGMAYYLALHDPRISALGLAATGVQLRDEADRRLFSDRRHGAMYSGSVDLFLTNGAPPQVFPTTASSPYEVPSPPGSRKTLHASVLLAPRPFYIVQGRGDPGTSVAGTQRLADLLAEVYPVLDPGALRPQVDVVDGPHSFDAQRRRLVTDWFARVLDASPVLGPPSDRLEHETPILPREVLERTPPDFGRITVHDIHSARAMATITQQRARQPFGTRTADDQRRLLRRLLMLPADQEARAGRPILLDERGFTLTDGVSTSARFWLLPLTRHLQAAVLTVAGEGSSKEVVLEISANDVLVPIKEQLVADLTAERAVAVLYLPGFGPLRSTQDKLGRLAVRMPERLGRTLLGIGVESTVAALDLLEILYPGARVFGRSEGVDAGNVLAFTTALDARVSVAHLSQAVDSFLDFLTAPTNPIPAPTLAIPGLAAFVDLEDLQHLAGDGRIQVRSHSDLSEYVLDLRP